jgi:putative sterol carrier protein
MTGTATRGMQSPTDTFFADLGGRRHQPLLKSASGIVRFDLIDGERVEHWCVTMDRGEVAVSRKNVRADAVVRLDRATFDGMVSGSVNAIAAVLRGALVAEGDLGLVLLFQRLFPAPERRNGPARAVSR